MPKLHRIISYADCIYWQSSYYRMRSDLSKIVLKAENETISLHHSLLIMFCLFTILLTCRHELALCNTIIQTSLSLSLTLIAMDTWVHPLFCGVGVALTLVFCAVFYKSLSVLLSLFFCHCIVCLSRLTAFYYPFGMFKSYYTNDNHNVLNFSQNLDNNSYLSKTLNRHQLRIFI